MAASEAQQKLQELHAPLNTDLEKTRRELNEMDTLLRQTNSEVEKLAQRELTVANRLRDLEVNVDKYSKADVKNFYTSAQEVQMRLHRCGVEVGPAHGQHQVHGGDGPRRAGRLRPGQGPVVG